MHLTRLQGQFLICHDFDHYMYKWMWPTAVKSKESLITGLSFHWSKYFPPETFGPHQAAFTDFGRSDIFS